MSNRRALRSAAALGLVLSLAAGAASAETLAEAIGLAYQTNPTLQAQRASLRALDETYVQARTGWRPTADAAATATSSYGPSSSLFGPTGNVRSESVAASVSATQPLYTGGRVASGVSAAEADIWSGRESLRAVEAQVMLNVVQAYVDVRRDLAALGIQQENVRVLQRQLEEASARFEVGEITRTDVAQAEARLAAAQANLSSAQANLSVSRAAYTNVVGQAPGDLTEEPVLPGLPADFDAAMDAAEQANPNLRSAQYAEDAARARVVQAKSQYLPTVGLRADWQAGSGLNPIDLTDQDEIRATATVAVPLFTGGLNSSRVRQQLERQNQAQIQVQGARRDVLRQVSNAWSILLASRAAYAAQEEQVRAQRIAAEGVRQENQVGLRTTLDVLNAEQELRNSELALVNARRDQYVASASLLSAMGRLEAANLVQGVETYDPKRNFDRVKGKGGVPWEPVVAVVDRFAKPGPSDSERDADAPVDQQLGADKASQ